MIIRVTRDGDLFYIAGDAELTANNDNVIDFEIEKEALEYAEKWERSYGKPSDIIDILDNVEIMCKVIITTFNFNWRYDKRYEFLMEKKKTFDFWNEVFCNNGGGFIGGYISKIEIYEDNEQIFVWEKNNG